MMILNIETSTKNCSVALSNNGAVVSYREIADTGYSHAEKLHVFIEDILKEAKITFNDLKAIAVSKGPGSYTGLRIGVSAAKGFCYALNLPLISIDTLTVLARQLQVHEEESIVPMIDARRMEVYSCVLDSNYKVIREIQSEILVEDSFSTYSKKLHFVGDSNEKAKTIIKGCNFVFHDVNKYPSAKEMCQLSFEKYKTNDFENVAYFEPYYLKEFMMTK